MVNVAYIRYHPILNKQNEVTDAYMDKIWRTTDDASPPPDESCEDGLVIGMFSQDGYKVVPFFYATKQTLPYTDKQYGDAFWHIRWKHIKW